ncbi:MAG: hydroxymethylbilane synthase [Deferribacteres bacterium]|nr:hydroxymethylbilane synthase [Deferribacteres bacterium]
MTRDKLVIATRGSKLALWQAEWVKSEIEKIEPSLKVELNKIRTTGDKILDVPLAQVGGKGLFVKEIEEAMLKGEADLAVHSMKDVPTALPAGLHLSAICKREDPRDAIITAAGKKSGTRNPEYDIINDLPRGARVGTSSLRRICQLLNRRPDLRLTNLRGNVDTRIRKLDEGEFDAIILAAAGVKRLGRADRITAILPAETSLPAIGQGAIGIECRVDDGFTNRLLGNLNHEETSICIRAERAFLERLEGGCQVPIAAHAQLENRTGSAESATLFIEGLVGSLDGKTIIRDSLRAGPGEAESAGKTLAEKLLSEGAEEILKEVYGQNS